VRNEEFIWFALKVISAYLVVFYYMFCCATFFQKKEALYNLIES